LKFTLADRHAKPLSKKEMAQLLGRPNILRLALFDKTGEPVVHPVWYYHSKGRFFVATDMHGAKAEALRKNPAVYFLVDENSQRAPPCGIRGKGIAKVVDDPDYATEVTKRNVKRYLGTLKSATAKAIIEMGKDSCVIEITPRYIATWKY
jgi:nitroimidazol reductase NimA-like FMN-containing flavoprotein (pyridoxamine 5'-phosphate oxidase superfamily)